MILQMTCLFVVLDCMDNVVFFFPFKKHICFLKLMKSAFGNICYIEKNSPAHSSQQLKEDISMILSAILGLVLLIPPGKDPAGFMERLREHIYTMKRQKISWVDRLNIPVKHGTLKTSSI